MSGRVGTRVAQSHWGHQHRARQPEAVRRHRVADRRRLRSMAVALAGAGLAVAAGAGRGGAAGAAGAPSYRLDALRQARAELEETNRRLRVEMATLKSLSRIEGKARAELGMVAPGPATRSASPASSCRGPAAAPPRCDRRAVVAERGREPGASGSSSVTP